MLDHDEAFPHENGKMPYFQKFVMSDSPPSPQQIKPQNTVAESIEEICN